MYHLYILQSFWSEKNKHIIILSLLRFSAKMKKERDEPPIKVWVLNQTIVS